MGWDGIGDSGGVAKCMTRGMGPGGEYGEKTWRRRLGTESQHQRGEMKRGAGPMTHCGIYSVQKMIVAATATVNTSHKFKFIMVWLHI